MAQHRSEFEFDGESLDIVYSPLTGFTEVTPESVLQEADRITEERGEFYGHPIDNHSCTASLVTAYLDRKYGVHLPLDPEDVCWFNILQKISREANSPKHDNLVDVAGFVKNIDETRREQRRRDTPK